MNAHPLTGATAGMFAPCAPSSPAACPAVSDRASLPPWADCDAGRDYARRVIAGPEGALGERVSAIGAAIALRRLYDSKVEDAWRRDGDWQAVWRQEKPADLVARLLKGAGR